MFIILLKILVINKNIYEKYDMNEQKSEAKKLQIANEMKSNTGE